MRRQVFLFSHISSFTAQDFIAQLMEFDRESNDEITVFINSGGGSVVDMFAMIDAMNMVKSPIKTVVMGMAASAAAIIAANGSKRLMTENSEFMLHEAWTITGGSVSEINESAERLTKYQDRLIDMLAKSTGQIKDKIIKDIKKTDKYFNAKEAIKYGLADEIIGKGEMEKFKLSEHIHVQAFEFTPETIDSKLVEVQLLRTGVFESPQYGRLNITASMLEHLKTNFDKNVRGIDVSIDYTHDNEEGEKPAAYWVKHLEVRDVDGEKHLYALGEFTPKGHKLVKEKEYKYASADFVVNYMTENGDYVQYVLCGGTLTNRPVIKGMNPIQLSETKTKERQVKFMNREQLINELRTHGVDVNALTSERDDLKNKLDQLENKLREVSKLPAEKDEEIKNLKSQLQKINSEVNDRDKEAAFNKLVEEGKVAPAQKDKVLSKFENADEIVDFYKDASPIVKTKSTGTSHEENSDELTAAEKALVESGEYTKEQIIENRTNR